MPRKRTDVHKPSAIDPGDYEFVACEHIKIQSFGDCHAVLANRETIRKHMERTGGNYSGHEHGGNCGVCGNANAIYTILYYHEKTNTYVRVGQDCANKMDMGGTVEMNRFKKVMEHWEEARAGKRKAQGLLAEAGIERAWELYVAKYEDLLVPVRVHKHDRCCPPDCDLTEFKDILYEERTIRDIVGKLVKYGNISDAQTNFIKNLLDKIEKRPILQAQRKAEADAAGPAPTGRQIVTGTVLMLKEVDKATYHYNDSETQTKLLIKLENGSKVWGNRFESLERGDVVTFKATFQVAENDPKFAYYKRAMIQQITCPQGVEHYHPSKETANAGL